jgi:glycosyltransferase involved in cell wall biosynthesis
MTGGREHRVLFMAPMPPPVGGVAEISRGLFESSLRAEFEMRSVDFTKRKDHRVRTFTIEAGDPLWAIVFWGRLLAGLVRFRPGIFYIASSFDYSFIRNALFMGTAKLFGAGVVCHFHGYRGGPLFGNPGRLQKLVLRLCARSFDRILYLSPAIKESMEGVLKSGRGVAVRNFVDVSEFRPSAGLAHHPPRIAYVGRLSEPKGIFDLIQAAGKLRSEGLEFVLDLAGLSETPAEEAEVRRAAQDAGLGPRVVFHGVKQGPEKALLLTEAALFVLPSWSEIFPVSLLEALASGLPVAATAVGAVPEILRDGVNGFLCAPRDPDSLAGAMRKLLTSPQLRETMGRANRKLAEEEYGREIAASRVAAVFKEVVR